jgi:hypothetical protein
MATWLFPLSPLQTTYCPAEEVPTVVATTPTTSKCCNILRALMIPFI